MIAFLDNALFSLPWPWSLVAVAAILAVVAVLAYVARSLDAGGALCAFVMGVTVLWTTRFAGFLLFMLFFVSCNIVGKISKRLRAKDSSPEVREKKGHRRDIMQVVSNGLMATLAALLWFFTGKVQALVMFGAAVAEATSDTFAGDVGRLSRKAPVSILTMRPVPKGLSGGVTALGMVGAMASSMVIALCWFISFKGVTVYEAALVGVMGFAGAVIDSYLGAAVQAQYYDPETKEISEDDERDGRKLELTRGIRWVDNDMVNLMSNTFSAVFALGMCTLILKLVR